MTKTKVDDFDEANIVSSNWIKFNVIEEDKVMGTLTAVRTMKSSIPGHENEMVKVYDLKVDYGSFHVQDDNKVVVPEPIVINEGEIYSIGGKDSIDRQMTNVKIGQKVGFKFVEQVPSKTKGFAPAKIIRVFTPKNDDGSYKMDEAFLEERNSNFDNM